MNQQSYNIHNSEMTDEALISMESYTSAKWKEVAEGHLINLFNAAFKRVPGYKDFVEKFGVSKEIQTLYQWTKIPSVDRVSYLRKYALEDLVWDGSLKKPLVFTATSGSTGNPFYFPRHEALDWQSQVMHELFLRHDNSLKSKQTLVLDCFGMGVWIGGLITYQAFKKITHRGYPFSILTPGSNKKEIFEALHHIGNKFEQIILCGYPPFIKDVIDEGVGQNIDWQSYNIKIIFAAETFSETFRDYIVAKTGIKNLYTDTMNIYGSADLGTMAVETPLSILVRRLSLAYPDLRKELFPETTRLPTLVQFNPRFTYFEAIEKNIFCTGNNELPLLRYEIGDHGGVFTYDDLVERANRVGISIESAVKEAKLTDVVNQMPFVYIYERSDLSTKLYGAIIYPEHVREALYHDSFKNVLTGKCVLITQHDQYQNEYLEVNVEYRPGVRTDAETIEKITEQIISHLLEKNAEYNYLHSLMASRVRPQVIVWDYEDPVHFSGKGKQKWVKKTI